VVKFFCYGRKPRWVSLRLNKFNYIARFFSWICYNNNVTEKNRVFSDDDVVRSVREGNTRNFEILIDRYKSKIINFIHKMIYDYDEAQSLSQDVFLKLFETIERYKMQDNFQAFIFTIAKNLTLNHIKKQKRVIFFSSFVSRNGESGSGTTKDDIFPDEETDDPQTLIEKKQEQEMLTKALKTLNENQRIALIMKVYLEFSYNQIADITGWSIPKIETLISRGKSNLKNEIRSSLEKGPGKKIQKQMQENKESNVLRVRAT
jgi:RNA polymerase sigma-70 factor (ECF subfamily)